MTRRRNHDGKRAELVAAAAQVVARDGVAASTTRRIAAEASVPLGTVHYWFAGKDDLLAAVVEQVLGDIGTATATAEALDSTGAPDLEAAFEAAWATVENDDRGRQLSMYELTTTALRTDGMEQLARQQYAAYRAVAREAISPWYAQSGLDLPGGVETLSRLIAYLFDGATLAWLADEDEADPMATFKLLAHLLQALTDQPVDAP